MLISSAQLCLASVCSAARSCGASCVWSTSSAISRSAARHLLCDFCFLPLLVSHNILSFCPSLLCALSELAAE